jgi:hypothetical protein
MRLLSLLPLIRAARPVLVASAGLVAATAGLAQALPKSSPFLPPAAAPGAAQSGPGAYEFVGMTTLGDQTLLGINRQQDKRSFWIPVGKTVGDITAVSYDPKTDRAVIRADGQTITLILRKGGVLPGIAATVAPTPAPLVVANGPTPVTVPTRPLSVQEEKEMEARMLVTDLLEIGQQQRKAYEEAQRQAAARAKAGQPSPPVTPPPAPPRP